MKKYIAIFLSILFIFGNILPCVSVFADTDYTNSQKEQVGALMFSSLLLNGDASELDFSDYTGDSGDLLIAFGEACLTGDFTGLVEYGFNWLGETVDSGIEYAQQGIRDLLWDISPDLYKYWYWTDEPLYSYDDYLPVGKFRNVSKDVLKIVTPPSDDSSPSPSPSPDYSFINNINEFYVFNQENGHHDVEYYNYYNNTFYWWQNNNKYTTSFNPRSYSYCSEHFYHVSNDSNSYYVIRTMLPLLDINLVDNGNGFTCTYSSSQFTKIDPRMDYDCYRIERFYNNPNDNYPAMYPRGISFSYYRSDFPDLNVALNYIYEHYSNINLYVNNVPWALIPSNPTYPIVIPDNLTIWNNEPIRYNFPDDTRIDIEGLVTKIKNAINISDVVKFDDIEDVFIDINGQTVVATTIIYRNDYDNLYNEQFPDVVLPNFNPNLIDGNMTYSLSSMETVVDETVDVLPVELKVVIGVGGILTIFACIIHRLLE